MAWLWNILLVIFGSCMVFADTALPPKCAAVSCLAPSCPKPFIPPGECCPVCPKVSPNTCTLERCIVPADCETYIPEGQCCPVCRKGKRCVYKGSFYKDGQTFKDDCNMCTCTNGNVGCTKIGCKTVKPGICPKPTGPGHCAEECFADSSCPLNQKCCSNGCGHTCQTPVGATDCTLVDCMPITCADQYTPPLGCCPVCRTGNYRPVNRE